MCQERQASSAFSVGVSPSIGQTFAKRLRCVLFASAILLLPSVVSAITIDTFNAGGYNAEDENGPCRIMATRIDPAISKAVVLSSVLGGVREATLSSTDGFAAARLCNDKATFSQGAGNTSLASYVWDGDTFSGVTSVTSLGPIDLFNDGADAFLLDLWTDRVATINPFVIQFRVYDASDFSTSKWSEAAIVIGGPGNPFQEKYATLSVPFSNFTTTGPGGGADFRNIGAFQLIINGDRSPALDVEFKNFRTNGTCVIIPQNGTVYDECGVCGGPGPGVCGCNTVDSDGDTVADCIDPCPTDGNKIDPGICGCGVVDFDSQSGEITCCDERDQRSAQFEIDSNLKKQEQTIKKFARRILKAAKKKAEKKFARKVMQQAAVLNNQGWELTWGAIPGELLMCPMGPRCIVLSYQDEANQLQTIVTSLEGLAQDAYTELKRIRGGKALKADQKLIKRARNLLKANTLAITNLVKEQVLCS